MKKLILVSCIVFAGVFALATDRLSNEIVCSKVAVSGEADNGLDIIVQSNDFAWAKWAIIIENGVLGSREIGTFQIPLQPVFDTYGNTLKYESQNFQLVLEAYSTRTGYQISGPATAVFQLPGYEKIVVQLKCKQVK